MRPSVKTVLIAYQPTKHPFPVPLLPEGWRQTVLRGLAGARNELPRTVLDDEISQDLQIQPTVDGSTLDRVGGQST
jgi:hypothetical protein